MKLHVEQIRDITRGAVRVTEEKDGIHFYRFTEAQEALYKNVKTDFYTKTHATAGIRVEFQTNSKKLEIKANFLSATSRKYFSLDVFVNGELNGYLDNFSNTDLPENYHTAEYEMGRFSKTFSLGEGEKEVCIYFPWSAITVIEEIILDDNAYVKPTKPKKKLLVYGDSITQGYDALRPSHRYPARIADAFNMEEINKALGGDVSCPELAQERDDFNPDYIMVAYGTNDWSICTKETAQQNCEGFYKELCNHYPDTPILTIAPIWRKDFCDFRKFGLFHEMEELIRETVKPYKNIRVISGYGFIPEDENYFSDKYLHPNDAGFEHYFQSLYKEIL